MKGRVRHAGFSHRTAREIGANPDKETQRKIADIVIKKDMTIKEMQDMVSTIKKAPEPIKEAPDKEYYWLPSAVCPTMKMITLQAIADSLERMSPTMELDPTIVEKARIPLERMTEIGR